GAGPRYKPSGSGQRQVHGSVGDARVHINITLGLETIAGIEPHGVDLGTEHDLAVAAAPGGLYQPLKYESTYAGTTRRPAHGHTTNMTIGQQTTGGNGNLIGIIG